MNKYLLSTLVLLVYVFSACERKPYVEHKLKFEKTANACNTNAQPFKMTSNFGGERFEFDKCLPSNFSKEQMTTSRNGDTVVVSFKQPAENEAKALFSITLDIDSYPRYSAIAIDGDMYNIVVGN